MLMLKALRNRSLALFWSGQALSSIGDEIFRVALMWLAVGLVGADAGYLGAAQYASLLLFCLIGGHWADRWDQRVTMIVVDAVRGILVLIPVFCYFAGRVSLPALVAVALALSALSAFFEPALQATLPEVSPDAETLQSATGLMSTTGRLSRAVGPTLVAMLAPLVDTIHFFTFDSLSFAVSAISVLRLGRSAPRPTSSSVRPSFWENVGADWRAVTARPLMRELMLVRGAVGGLWGTAYVLGLTLLCAKLAPGDMGAFGRTVAWYGVGNVAGALFVGNIHRPRPAALLFTGHIALGLGFAAIGAAPTIGWLGAACVFAGFGGPVNDVPFVDIVQKLYPVADIPKIFRIRLAVETGAALSLLAAAPSLVAHFSARALVIFCGLGVAAFGAVGLSQYGEERERAPRDI
jgi:MFS family permease